ncbi:3-hydroxyisobutyryl-CoA hydrolase protein 2, mitochondrial [Trifolium repens]|nr:3-hydroxyisobutyryl-CoA hydrolase protein 2, mitochondrial [Trifolium repens]
MAMQCRRRAVWWLLQQQRANHHHHQLSRTLTLSSSSSVDDEHLQQQVLVEGRNGYSRPALLNRPSALNAIKSSTPPWSLTHSLFFQFSISSWFFFFF